MGKGLTTMEKIKDKQKMKEKRKEYFTVAILNNSPFKHLSNFLKSFNGNKELLNKVEFLGKNYSFSLLNNQFPNYIKWDFFQFLRGDFPK